MRTSVCFLLTLGALVVLFHASPARADVPITGTVAEVGVFIFNQTTVFRFKLTDLNQTKTCMQALNPPVGAGYAWFWGNNTNPAQTYADPPFREWYAALLVSKKGSPITCTIGDNVGCHVTSCTLQ